MVERFTKQVMEYDLGTPTRRVEISDGSRNGSFADLNQFAREFAGELATALRAEGQQHPARPPRRPQPDLREG